MKVLHLITRLDPGGSAENTLLTCQHLVANGWSATLAAGPGWTSEDADVGDAQVPVTIVSAMRRDPSVSDVRAFWQIWRLLRRERPTIVHTHSAKAGVLGRWAAWLARVPLIVHTPHGHVLYGYAGGIKNRLYLQAERLCAPITDRLVALSKGEMLESSEAGIGALDKWVVIPSGVDVDAIAAPHEPRTSGPLRIGCVARLEHVKGIDVLVRATARLAVAEQPAFEVLVWGDGRELAGLRGLIDEIGVADRLRFVGTDEPVTDFLRRLDIYVQPSRNEGMGRALVLAQAAGLATVASDVCGIPDVVLDGRTGVLVEPDDPESLGDAIRRLMLDEETRKDFGRAARSWIMECDETGFPRFSTAAMLWRLERLYQELTNDRAA